MGGGVVPCPISPVPSHSLPANSKPSDGDGYLSTETTRQERDWEANATILSGDLNGNDNHNVDPDEPTRAENSYHVLWAINIDDTAILDGFTITGGNANVDGETSDNDGGGMRNLASSPTLSNLIFTNNSALIHGGGMENIFQSHPILTNVTFSHNFAGDKGGGMLNHPSSNPLLTNVTFLDNSAYIGGGMFNKTNNPTMRDVTFTGNHAIYSGGGIYNLQNGSPTSEGLLIQKGIRATLNNNFSRTKRLGNIYMISLL